MVQARARVRYQDRFAAVLSFRRSRRQNGSFGAYLDRPTIRVMVSAADTIS